MPSIIFKKSVEGFGISFIEAASYGVGSIGGIHGGASDAIQNEIFEETRDNVLTQHIQLNSVLVRDVTLPTAIKEGIERKLVQEQEALEYEFRLVKAEQEAEKEDVHEYTKGNAINIGEEA